MIWGEVINGVRGLHLKLIKDFAVDPKTFLKDQELRIEGFPYPEAKDDFDEWDEFPLEADLQDVIPLHPVERVLIEGSILPIQKVSFHSKNEIDVLFGSILRLEKEWLEKLRLDSPDKLQFVENDCAVQALRISTKAGFSKLSAVKSKSSQGGHS